MAGDNIQQHNSWYSSLAGAIRHHPLADAVVLAGVAGLASIIFLSNGSSPSIPQVT